MQPFRHMNVSTIEEAVKKKNKKALFIAGGTDCLSLLKNNILPAGPEMLINIKTVAGLAEIAEDSQGLTIGALATLSHIAASPAVKKTYPLLADAARTVASPQIRNMGTIGGNLCQHTRCWFYRASPFTGRSYDCYRKGGGKCFAPAGDNRYHAVMGGERCFAVCPSDMAVALSALDAKVVVQGRAGERIVSVPEFFTVMGTILQTHEMVREIKIPRPPAGAKQAFLKFRLRKVLDFAVVSTATLVSLDDSGICREARIVLGAVAPMPIRAVKAESTLRGKRLGEREAEEAAGAALAGARPLSMNAYKVEIARTLVKRALPVSKS